MRSKALPMALRSTLVEVIEQVATQAADVRGDGLLQSREPSIGEHSVVGPRVLGRLLTADQPLGLHPPDGTADRAQRLLAAPSQFAEPQRAVGSLGQKHQRDEFGVRHAMLTLQVNIELPHHGHKTRVQGPNHLEFSHAKRGHPFDLRTSRSLAARFTSCHESQHTEYLLARASKALPCEGASRSACQPAANPGSRMATNPLA